ncbi:helix-turn-helix domain-containing protein [uncultured Enorma sp.]|uniref:helix-turn-helix domain-containing protein n=1 Tax=uncultured Enorma sp. TaxID=1714346 RepID=UPI002804A66A|nr:helix-turn-helix domain-containing protein [uncultured Enorma sp.]
MPGYLTAETIKGLREVRGLTQRALADAVGVTDKAVSKWESGRGLPDISLVESLSAALGVSVAELLTGDVRQNANRAGNLMRARFYVCPVCGNVIYALGEGSFSCCGVHLAPCEAEEPDEAHALQAERIEDEWYVTLDHPMTKEHFISFIAYVTMDGITFKKLYPEQEAAARFRMGASGALYAYCNRHGLFKVRTPRRERGASRA